MVDNLSNASKYLVSYLFLSVISQYWSDGIVCKFELTWYEFRGSFRRKHVPLFIAYTIIHLQKKFVLHSKKYREDREWLTAFRNAVSTRLSGPAKNLEDAIRILVLQSASQKVTCVTRKHFGTTINTIYFNGMLEPLEMCKTDSSFRFVIAERSARSSSTTYIYL